MVLVLTVQGERREPLAAPDTQGPKASRESRAPREYLDQWETQACQDPWVPKDLTVPRADKACPEIEEAKDHPAQRDLSVALAKMADKVTQEKRDPRVLTAYRGARALLELQDQTVSPVYLEKAALLERQEKMESQALLVSPVIVVPPD